jgi:hypothetical protein
LSGSKSLFETSVKQNKPSVIHVIEMKLFVLNTIHADTESNYDDDSATGFVIKMLVKDDIVFIRTTGQFIPEGSLTNGYMRWTFSGWLIK